MSKSNNQVHGNATVTREMIIEALKENYIRNEGFSNLHAALELQGLDDEAYDIMGLIQLYNNLANSEGHPIGNLYKNPEVVMQGAVVTSSQAENAFEDIAKFYIKEFLALQILLKMGEHDPETLLVIFSQKVTFSACLEQTLIEINDYNVDPANFHFSSVTEENKTPARGDVEEKRPAASDISPAQAQAAPIAQGSSRADREEKHAPVVVHAAPAQTQAQGEDPVARQIKIWQESYVNNVEILERLQRMDQFKNTATVATILEFKEFSSLAHIFQGLTDSLSSAASSSQGISRADREEKGAPAQVHAPAIQNPILAREKNLVIEAIKLAKSQNAPDHQILQTINVKYKHSETTIKVKELVRGGSTLSDAFQNVLNEDAEAGMIAFPRPDQARLLEEMAALQILENDENVQALGGSHFDLD